MLISNPLHADSRGAGRAKRNLCQAGISHGDWSGAGKGQKSVYQHVLNSIDRPVDHIPAEGIRQLRQVLIRRTAVRCFFLLRWQEGGTKAEQDVANRP
uniref:Uncharacterized protein n=1 Tax=Desulfovibrio desulfuricans (strain ATCC 27774 / DSM 6949 / MB) TaxID=525146 RepID=B8J408_DESDA